MSRELIVSDYDGVIKVKQGDTYIMKNGLFTDNFDEQTLINISTGRPFSSFQNEITRYNLSFDYLSCANGNAIFNKNQQVLYSSNFNMSKLGILAPFYHLIEDITKVDVYGIESSSVFALKVHLKEDNISRKKIIEFLSRSVIYDYVTVGPGKFNIYIFNRSDKANAIDYLLSNILTNTVDIYTIGDGLNDIWMLTQYNGYCLNKDIRGDFKNCSNLEEAVIDIKESIARKRCK